MTSIDGLCFETPLKIDVEKVGDYVHVEKYSKLRLTIDSDVLLQVQLEWSINGIDRALYTGIKVGSNIWKSDEYPVLLPYLRIRILSNSSQPNERLMVYTSAISLNKCYTDKSIPPVLSSMSIESVEPQPQKRGWLSKTKKVAISPASTLLDYRLPQYIPPGSILVGGRNGKIEAVPRGEAGEYLMMGQNGPMWLLE